MLRLCMFIVQVSWETEFFESVELFLEDGLQMVVCGEELYLQDSLEMAICQ